jgi:exonuclease III
MKKYISCLILLAVAALTTLSAQKTRVLLDGYFEDWNDRIYDYSDPAGDGRFGYDFTSMVIENDENYIYIYFDTGLDINIQENNDIALILDTDNDYETGYPIDNMGAELIYFFGDRGGAFYSGNNQINIEHDDIGLITLPSVSSDRFEIGLDRGATINGNLLFTENNFKVMLFQDVQNGDKFPDQSGGLDYTVGEEPLAELPAYSIKKHSRADFRLLSYNVQQDNLFDRQNEFQRQITALAPDIIAFQEIYDHSANQTMSLIQSWLGGTWYAAKQGSDIITISRFPIRESHYVAGNGAFLIDVNGDEILLVNAHLPCCDNDAGRQEEVDQIMAFIREAKAGQNSLDLKDLTPVIIAGDMNFVGKNRQIKTFLEGDIQNEFLFGEDFNPDWDDTGFKDLLPFMSQTPFAVTWYNERSDYNPGRLDYIICSDAVLKDLNAFNLFTDALPQDSLISYALLQNDTGRSSDHLPVIADFEIDYTNRAETYYSNEDQIAHVFPVPFSNQFTIQWLDPKMNMTFMTVYNIKGEQVFSRQLDGLTGENINTSDWPSGIYLLMLEQQGRNQQKIIISRN